MRIGIVGAGAIAKTAHLPAYSAISSTEVVGIADTNEASAKKLAKEFGIPKWYSSFEELLRDDSIELVDICTPPMVRLKIIELAAQKGKHILVEKPLALSLTEAIKINELVTRHNVKLNVVQNYRYFPSVQKAKKRIEQGYLGSVISMQGSALTSHPADLTKATWLYHYGGVLFDFAPHLVDMLLWLNDSPVEKVFAFGGDMTGNMGFINYAQIAMQFKNKSVAIADASWLTATLGARFTMNVHGSGGHLLMDIRNDSLVEFHGMFTPLDELNHSIKKMAKVTKGIVNGSYFKCSRMLHQALTKDFIESIQKDAIPPVPAAHGLAVISVLDAAKQSIIQGKPITINDFQKIQAVISNS